MPSGLVGRPEVLEDAEDIRLPPVQVNWWRDVGTIESSLENLVPYLWLLKLAHIYYFAIHWQTYL
jgi:hypothetical protein